MKSTKSEVRSVEIICTGCPLGCRTTLVLDSKGNVTALKDAECKRGEKYVLEEYRTPVRYLTTTVRTGDQRVPLLPVKSSKPMPKALLADGMRATIDVGLKPPVNTGDIVVPNVAGTGIDLVATACWNLGPQVQGS